MTTATGQTKHSWQTKQAILIRFGMWDPFFRNTVIENKKDPGQITIEGVEYLQMDLTEPKWKF